MKHAGRITSILVFTFIMSCNPRIGESLRKNDLKKDVRFETSYGTIILRLSDSTPQHRNNFLKLVKTGFYDSLLFHRVIPDFMIQGGDPDSKRAVTGAGLGEGDVGYTIPAEFNPTLYNKRGALAAARDDNPQKASSGCQFYIVEGKVFPDSVISKIEQSRPDLKIPPEHRKVYETIGGSPWLDQAYTVFGEVVGGMEVVDSIAHAVRDEKDRPKQDIRIIKATLVKRK